MDGAYKDISTYDLHEVGQSNAHIAKQVGDIRRVAIVDDCAIDHKVLRLQLKKSFGDRITIEHYTSVDQLLGDDVETPDAVILDRCLKGGQLSEGRIREIRSRHKNCGVILHTGMMTPSIRSTASHEGAFAVVEKGSLDRYALKSLIETAFVVGPTIKLAGQFKNQPRQSH